MKTHFLWIAFVGAIPVSLSAQDQAKKLELIVAETLNQRDVIGSLGLPLGQAAEIVATVVYGDDLKTKGDSGRYLLLVKIVDGQLLEAPRLIKFLVAPGVTDVHVANDSFDLYKLKNHQKAKMLSSAEIEELEKGYVGSQVKLLVYETGGFSGIPNGLPKDVPLWQDYRFHFSTSLVVLKQRD